MASPETVPPQVRSPVSVGQLVDRKYRIDGVLGAGGMGIVVSATHIALEEPVALKFMTVAEGRGDSTARSRFLREAKAARKLTSAHVARVFDVGQLPSGEPYIVMELLKGDDLAKHLRTQGRLTAADTVRFMLQVCDAIREAHALGIVHRDLKPQNLFLTQRPGGGTVIKVLDFGIAKSLESSGTDPSLTTSQNVVGSPVYMSPEQLRASKHVDERSDIWSLGVIMFELLSGKVPFVGDSVLELGMRIMTVPAPSLTDLRTEVPAALADAVQKCLEKDPDKRFATVDALANALKPFIDISHRSLPFADTLSEDSTPFGGEFAGTKGGATVGTSRTIRTWGAVAIVATLIAMVTVAWPRGQSPRALSTGGTTSATPAVAGSTFHVSLKVSPATARLRFDSEALSAVPFSRDVARDGQPHTIVLEAEGYEPLELSFRDAPPSEDVSLKPLPHSPPTATWQPVDPPASPIVAVRHEPIAPAVPTGRPSSASVTAPSPSTPSVATSTTAPAQPPSVPVTTAPVTTAPVTTATGVPRTTNGAPIVR